MGEPRPDLVERLRREAWGHRAVGHPLAALLEEAADEIERLRAEGEQ